MSLPEECRNAFTLPVAFQEVGSGLMMKDTSISLVCWEWGHNPALVATLEAGCLLQSVKTGPQAELGLNCCYSQAQMCVAGILLEYRIFSLQKEN